MNFTSLDLHQTNSFSEIFLDYLSDHEKLRSFYKYRPHLSSFGELIPLKGEAFPASHREVLVEALKEQYQGIDSAPLAEIERLAEAKTFTVTTGHQLNLFTGPLYFIYKIITTIKLAQELREAYPDYHFVPLYWMATEDHDFEEINHFYLFNKKIQWESSQKGAVGRFKLDGMAAIFEQLRDRLPQFEAAYLQADDLSQATIQLVNSLFQEENLVILDADRPSLKALFKDVIQDDLFQGSAQQKVIASSEALEKLGYKSQIFPREINFFYLEEQLRSRLIAQEGGFGVQNEDLSFTEAEVKELLDKHPERFSPNVVLRPLYQEVILPNLAHQCRP
ncbi:MAG: bacillithiol biosynthesis cysteine-adding enzyme BshC, partial [Bacteroidota bacterium]